MATEHFLRINNFSEIITIADGAAGATEFKLQYGSWSPNVANLRRDLIGGKSPYEDVVEDLDLIVTGTTVPLVLANLAKLQRMLDQAERWARGENVQVTMLEYSPKGATASSAANPLSAVILGRAAGDQTRTIQLPGTLHDLGSTNLIVVDVHVAIRRRGLWHTTEDTVAAGGVNNGDLATFVMSETRTVAAPVMVELSSFVYGKTASLRAHGAFILIGEAMSGNIPIVIVNAEVAGTGAPWTSVAAGLNARNTNVLRYTPTVTTEVQSPTLGTPAVPTSARPPDLIGMFINVRPHATTSFKVRSKIDSAAAFNQYTQQVVIPANATQYPYWVYLGEVPASPNTISASYLAITASVAGGSLDIDTVVFIAKLGVQVVTILAPGDSDAASAIATGDFALDHGLLGRVAPDVSLVSRKLPYKGNAVITTKAGTLYGLLLATGGGTSVNGDEYRQAGTASDALLANSWDLTRRRSYLVPE